MNQVIRPQIPYRAPIHGGLHDGKRIEIKGQVPYGADVFQVNLLTGSESISDRPLHISVRFKIRVVVRNTLKDNSWGAEERNGSFPFKHGGDFTMVISVNPEAYRIDVNGQNCWLYAHRIAFMRVTSIFIDGDVQIERIHFMNKITSGIPAAISPGITRGISPWITQGISPGITHGISPGIIPGITPGISPYQRPASVMPILTGPEVDPCIFPIHGGLTPHACFQIIAQPVRNPYKFSISLQTGGNLMPPDIGLRMDVRFHNHSITRNSRDGTIWGAEESDITAFPFVSGCNFCMLIRILADRFEVLVNQHYLFTFFFRSPNLSRINTLYIENLIVTSISY